jgi:hypothetical protein
MTRGVTAEHARRLGQGFVGAMGLLVAWNLYVIVRNQHDFSPGNQIRVRSHHIERLAKKDELGLVRDTFGTYYQLRVLAGKTVVMDRQYAFLPFYMERIARIHVELSDEKRTLTAAQVEALAPEVDETVTIATGAKVAIVRDDAETRYVFVRTPGARMILPETRYQRIVAEAKP